MEGRHPASQDRAVSAGRAAWPPPWPPHSSSCHYWRRMLHRCQPAPEIPGAACAACQPSPASTHLQELPLFDRPLHGARWQACRRRGLRLSLGARLPQLPACVYTHTKAGHRAGQPAIEGQEGAPAGAVLDPQTTASEAGRHTAMQPDTPTMRPCNQMQTNQQRNWTSRQARKPTAGPPSGRTCRGRCD